MSVMDRITGKKPREEAIRQSIQDRFGGERNRHGQPVVRGYSLGPQSAAEIKAKVTAMRENTDREIARHRDELNRLENLVREGEMLACAVVDRYEEATNRVRNAMADLLSIGICELSAHLQAVNTAARRQLDEPKVAADAEASNPQPDMGIPGTASWDAVSRGDFQGHWSRARLAEPAQSVSGLGDIGDPTEAKTHHGPRQGD